MASRIILRNFPLIQAVALTVLALATSAHDYVPGKKQTAPILLKGGTLHTVTGGVRENTDILIEGGRIARIDKNISAPAGSEIIDVTGQHVYPGLIAPITTIGLIEIDQVRATNDRDEVGKENPEVRAHIAYNPDSEIIPTVRSNGVSTALIVPEGSLFRGFSSLMNLDGWNWEDAGEKLDVGLHFSWPRASIITAWWMTQTPEEQKKENVEELESIGDWFEDASAYAKARRGNPNQPKDIRLESLLPVIEKRAPLIVHASDLRQIEQAVAFARKWSLRLVIAEGQEAWKAIDLLKRENIPVILSRTQALPFREDDDYDLAFKTPKVLIDAGVKTALGGGLGSWRVRDLPFHVGQAIAFGLTPEQALRAVTLTPAEIFGVEKELGSLEVGKKGTVVVSKGDIFDHVSNNVTHMYIEGRKVDLDSRHKELYRKFSQKGRP